ncbi:hypothetical protein GWI33_016791 [Rhynchophorus ferrugineus]|uniref:Uncharacterized protein n=1 Tax=Rhynchophorus ferrugineus TaxID=354439 RepID=A0A834I092_RHYFE|nr:hypothetical protein GWI33_016791 [Rhynchophorus ferrugineus]
MTTSENKSFRKNYAGSGINKNLLTPCRRIGLSRTKKTPKNLCAIPESNLPSLTPKDKKDRAAIPEIHTNSVIDKQKIIESTGKECLRIKNLEKGDLTIGSKKINYKTDSQEKKGPILKESNNFKEDSKTNASTEKTKPRIAGEESEIKLIKMKGKKRKKLDFDSSSASDSAKILDKTDLVKKEKTNCENTNILLAKFTTEDYLKEFSVNPSAFYDEHNEQNFDDFIAFSDKWKSKKTKSMSLTKSSEQLKKVSDALKEEKKSKQLSLSKDLQEINVQSKYDSNEEDDVFISSPQTQQQKDDLLRLIAVKEAEIRQKEEKLEQLKRARVYKTKHSPEKVAVHSTKWLNSCRQALMDLLVKMQEHGSMNMEILVKNLKIPSGIVEKLNV